MTHICLGACMATSLAVEVEARLEYPKIYIGFWKNQSNRWPYNLDDRRLVSGLIPKFLMGFRSKPVLALPHKTNFSQKIKEIRNITLVVMMYFLLKFNTTYIKKDYYSYINL